MPYSVLACIGAIKAKGVAKIIVEYCQPLLGASIEVAIATIIQQMASLTA